MIDEIGNVPLAAEEMPQEAVQSFMMRNQPADALVIRSNEARRTYGYQVDEDQAARQDVRSLQSLFAAVTAGTPT
jgi:hypothetical protein